jgi:predicted secreted protein
MQESNSVPTWWILLFLVLALGLGALAVSAVGGSLIAAVTLPA